MWLEELVGIPLEPDGDAMQAEIIPGSAAQAQSSKFPVIFELRVILGI